MLLTASALIAVDKSTVCPPEPAAAPPSLVFIPDRKLCSSLRIFELPSLDAPPEAVAPVAFWMAVAKSTPVVRFREFIESLEAEVDRRVALGACGVTVGIDWLVGVDGLAAVDPAVVGAGAVDRAEAAAEDRLEFRDELSDGRLIKKSVRI